MSEKIVIDLEIIQVCIANEIDNCFEDKRFFFQPLFEV